MGDVISSPSAARTTDAVAHTVFGNVRTYVSAYVGLEVWSEICVEVAGVTDVLHLNGIKVQPDPSLTPRRLLVLIGSFIVANFDIPAKAPVVAPLPAPEPPDTVSH